MKPSLIAKDINVRAAADDLIDNDFLRASSAPYGSGFVLVLHGLNLSSEQIAQELDLTRMMRAR